MRVIESPCLENNFLTEHAKLLINSYFKLTKKHLVQKQKSNITASQALFNAPFCVVSHGLEDNPIFNYANATALNLFELDWYDFTSLPSMQSAEPINRVERDVLLARVTRDNYIDDYSGIRISSTGRRFLIENAEIWNIFNEANEYCGQAAMFHQWTNLNN